MVDFSCASNLVVKHSICHHMGVLYMCHRHILTASCSLSASSVRCSALSWTVIQVCPFISLNQALHPPCSTEQRRWDATQAQRCTACSFSTAASHKPVSDVYSSHHVSSLWPSRAPCWQPTALAACPGTWLQPCRTLRPRDCSLCSRKVTDLVGPWASRNTKQHCWTQSVSPCSVHQSSAHHSLTTSRTLHGRAATFTH